MTRSSRITVVVAESSPIVAAGIASCLRRLPKLTVKPLEVHTHDDLDNAIATMHPDIVIANPAFCGEFSPAQLRRGTDRHFKLVAIDTGNLDRNARKLYDEALRISDDIATIESRIASLVASGKQETEEKESLSNREKEIVALVVKGMTNKEIADKLFLSLHTVNTHRRNIARKLEIHSATGLTIYAIMNRLVDLSEIKI